MQKSLIVGAAVAASLACLLAVLFVTRTPAVVESASAERDVLPRSTASSSASVADSSGAFERGEPKLDESSPLSNREALRAADGTPDRAPDRAPGRAAEKQPAIDRGAPIAPGSVRFCGRVERADGKPAANARVGLFASVVGEPLKNPLARARTSSSGEFCIDLADPSGPSALILLVCADRFLPLTLPLERPAQSLVELGSLKLAHGVSIGGRVQSGGQPVPRAEIAAVLDSALENFALDDRFLKWSHRRFVWAFAIADTTRDGAFEIAGLEPENYRVRLSSLRGRQAVLGLESSANREVRAPAEGVEFALDAATVQVNFTSDGKPLAGVQAQVKYEGGHVSAVSDDAGACTFKIVPHLDFTLLASHANYKTQRLALTAPAAGEQRVETLSLDAYAPPASVLFDVVPPGNERVYRARFTFYGFGSSDGKPSFVKEVDLKSPQREVVAHTNGARDELEIADVPMDSYRVVVQAGELIGYATSAHGNAPYFSYCDAEVALAVPATGRVRVTVNVAPRAAIQVAARDASGRMLHANAKLIDLAGTPVETSLAVKRNGILESMTALDDGDYTTIRSTLCSGSADLELACAGFRTKRVPVSLEGQHAPPIDVTLERE
jgi:hypothetical protein